MKLVRRNSQGRIHISNKLFGVYDTYKLRKMFKTRNRLVIWKKESRIIFYLTSLRHIVVIRRFRLKRIFVNHLWSQTPVLLLLYNIMEYMSSVPWARHSHLDVFERVGKMRTNTDRITIVLRVASREQFIPSYIMWI